MGIINTIMLATSNRYITVAIGKGDSQDINKTFNVNLTVHAAIAVISLIIALPLGTWYIKSYEFNTLVQKYFPPAVDKSNILRKFAVQF